VVVSLDRNDVTVSQTYTLTVTDPLEITSDPKTDATQWVLYRYFVIYNGSGTFSIETDPPAPWLSIDQEGVLSGTPPAPGTVHVVITAENSETVLTQEFDLQIAPALKIFSEPVDTAYVNDPYFYQVLYEGAGTFSLITDHPVSWLSIDQEGVLSGIPEMADMINVTIKMKNDDETYYQVFNLYILHPIGISPDHQGALMIYPNPASEQITIRNAVPGEMITLYSATGVELFSTIPASNSLVIPVSALGSGSYILQSNNRAYPVVIE